MHPDLMRYLANQRGSEMRARARQATLARRIRRELRRRTTAAVTAGFALPRIPDYVDGTFRDTELARPGARPDGERLGRRHADGRRAA
jgi:hypothetical protein